MLELRRMVMVGMLLGAAVCTAAEDATLAGIRALLAPMRAEPYKAAGPRGSRPALTQVKHKLREWIERRLHEAHTEDQGRTLELQLNTELRNAKLSCDWAAIPQIAGCPARGQPGFLGDIRIALKEMLVVTTTVGVDCGFDQSAYAYHAINGQRKRFWQSETNNYVEGKYVPLNFLGIQLSSRDYLNKDADPNVRLLLVLARDPAYCESNWYNVYYRLWRLRIDRPEESLLLDGQERAFLAANVDGTVSADEVLIQYYTSTTYTDFKIRPAVRRYVLKAEKLERVEPLALGPRDFADEWMRTDWTGSSRWTSVGVSAASLQPMHRKENFLGGEYTNTKHCEQHPDHWQVGLSWSKFDGRTIVETRHMYFLVRWLPPYRFR